MADEQDLVIVTTDFVGRMSMLFIGALAASLALDDEDAAFEAGKNLGEMFRGIYPRPEKFEDDLRFMEKIVGAMGSALIHERADATWADIHAGLKDYVAQMDRYKANVAVLEEIGALDPEED